MRTTSTPCSTSVRFTAAASRVAAIALALTALGVAPATLVPLAQAAEEEPLGEPVAKPLAWILDHRSGTGVPVTDATVGGRRSARSPDAGRFNTPGPTGYSPAQMRKAYEFDKLGNDGKRQVIAITIAFDYPNVAADLKTFIKTFKLKDMYGLPGRKPCTVASGPHPCFEVVYARGTQPPFDASWAVEGALDVQWAHAIAPGADILYVEASSNNIVDLFQSVQVATNMGATVVSMSWGAAEFPLQSIFEPLFDIPGITFVAASGDTGSQAFYPATSPRVVAVGGTTLRLDKKGKRKGPEIAWMHSAGGISQFMLEPGYQTTYPIPPTGGFRGAPDVAYNADPTTGVSVFSSQRPDGEVGWMVLGGTSASAPQWAGLFALANQRRETGNLSSNDLVDRAIYSLVQDDDDYEDLFVDIKIGETTAGCGSLCTADTGYDFVTGLGSPRAKKLVDELDDY
jgi:subtilase family serine protease